MSTVTDSTDEELEARLAFHGYSAAFIRPLWYRVYVMLGIRTPLPVQMNLQEHLFFGGAQVLMLLAAAYAAAWALGLVSRVPAGLVVILTLLLPGLNWVRYRRARNRFRSSRQACP